MENIRFFVGDLLDVIDLPRRVQMIVANLPYIPTGVIGELPREVQHEPRSALDGGADGLDLIRRLITQSGGRTKYLALEFGDGQAAKIESACCEAGYTLIRVFPDLTGCERILIAEAAPAML
jgi:release factor glutamine methyltransferase